MELYPDIEPFDSGRLRVSDIHVLHYEQSGNDKGNPVVVLHGGPGSGSNPKDRRFFDPKVYRIIQFDQRGSGKSTPAADLRDNTTWALVEDVERLRTHLGVDKWVVFGGSWGSTLALAYSQTHPDRVKGLIVRGIYTLTRWEDLWVNQEGASAIFPDYWEDYVNTIPQCERGDLLSAYHRRMTGDDPVEKERCIRAWNRWEDVLSQLVADEKELEARRLKDEVADLQHAVIECHYFVHGGWLKSENQLLDDVSKIRHLPGIIIQGRYDMVCPMKTAWALHKRWPEADFHIIPDAGHTSREPGTTQKIFEAAEKFKTL